MGEKNSWLRACLKNY